MVVKIKGDRPWGKIMSAKSSKFLLLGLHFKIFTHNNLRLKSDGKLVHRVPEGNLSETLNVVSG